MLLLVASCGPVRSPEIVPRYAVLTNLPPQSPMHRSARWLAEHRLGTIVQFSNMDRDAPAVLRKLRELSPSFVAVVVRPEDLDANLQLAIFELSCRVDPDPFPDFAWGYFVARDTAYLDRQMKAVQVADVKMDKRLLRFTRVEAGADASSASVADLEWASRLPCLTLWVKPGDAAFLRRHRTDLEGADFIAFCGRGSAGGILGLPAEELALLRLDSAAVFSAADYTGAAGAAFDASGDEIVRRPVRPERSFAQSIIGSGPAAFFAPLHKTDVRLAEFEWTEAILRDQPLGLAVKREYDLSVLLSGYSNPAIGRFVDGRTAPTGSENPAFLALTRVMYGDPLLQPFSRRTAGPLLEEERLDTIDTQGNRVRRFRWRVVSPDCVPFFTDPFTGGRQIVWLRAPCPAGTRRAAAALDLCEAGGAKVSASIEAQALEFWRDEAIHHVVLRGDGVARKDLRIGISISLR